MDKSSNRVKLTRYDYLKPIDDFIKLNDFEEFVIVETRYKPDNYNIVLNLVDSHIGEFEFEGKKAFYFRIRCGENYIIILDNPNKYKYYKTKFKELYVLSGYIDYSKFKHKENAFNYIKCIKIKNFNFIEDLNWATILPFLERFKSDLRIKNLCIYLHGIPGSGKSWFAQQIALFLNIKIYSFKLSNIQEAVLELSKDSLILIEEIDKVLVNSDFADGEIASSLLSLMDKTDLPDRSILVMISNDDISSSNPILCREGRMDIKLKFGTISIEQTKSLIQYWKNLDEITDELAAYVWNIVKEKHTIAELYAALRNLNVQNKPIRGNLKDALRPNTVKNDMLYY